MTQTAFGLTVVAVAFLPCVESVVLNLLAIVLKREDRQKGMKTNTAGERWRTKSAEHIVTHRDKPVIPPEQNPSVSRSCAHTVPDRRRTEGYSKKRKNSGGGSTPILTFKMEIWEKSFSSK